MTANATLRKAFLRPATVALVGASADVTKINSRPQRFLKRFGFEGRVLPINPSRKEVLGERAYPDLRSAPGPIDHAFVMVPAAAVPDVIEQCCELHVPVATLFTAGFAEVGEAGRRVQQDIVTRARAAGMRLLGPNCMGIVNVHDRLSLTVNAVIEREALVAGPLSLISQSGSITGAILSRAQARGLGFAKLISVGNESDLGVGELTDMLVDDEHTGAILLFLETFRDADRLAEASRRAYAAGKPVIAYKLGRSSIGRRAATSHTGAMTGPDEVSNAFFREHGIIRVETFEGLFETAQLVIGRRPPRGRRASVVSGSGGAAAMVVDRLGVLGADVVGPSPDVIAKLAAAGIHVSDAPVTDIPMGQSVGGRYSAILSALLASAHSDAVIGVIGSSAQYPQTIVERVLNVGGRDVKPLAVFLAPRADDALGELQKHGVASFRTPESCADAVYAYLNWRAPGERPQVDNEAVAAGLAAPAGGKSLSERDAGALFLALGIPVAAHCVVRSGIDRVELPGPFAVKVLSPDILHKTEAGLVRLDVAGESVADAAEHMLREARERFPGARVEGVLVQQMERGLAEAIIGYRRDPEIGPIVLLGVGGITAEITKRVVVRVAPITLGTAREMIDELRELSAVLNGFRNLPRGDTEALAHALRAMSLLARGPFRAVADAEINPLIVREEGRGVVAVDGLVVLA